MNMELSEEPPHKKRRLSNEQEAKTTVHSSFSRPISPPPLWRTQEVPPKLKSSPFNLTSIQNLPKSYNVDAVTLKDILGDPLIAECWEFNYLHDLDFLMNSFDQDVRALVKVHVVHGFWKKDEPAREALEVSTAIQLPLV